MKVCIVAEGCYPYVVGGVSGWINSMIKSFPNIEFILLTIVANRSVRGKFVYELPENLTQVYELYLEDCEWEEGERERKVRKRFHLSKKERTELTNLVMNRKIEWGVIFDLFQRKGVSVDEDLAGTQYHYQYIEKSEEVIDHGIQIISSDKNKNEKTTFQFKFFS